jgi:hypothetical protein
VIRTEGISFSLSHVGVIGGDYTFREFSSEPDLREIDLRCED